MAGSGVQNKGLHEGTHKALPNAAGPLSRYPLFKCEDIEDTCEQVQRNFGPYKLQVLKSNRNLTAQFDGIFFKGIALFSVNYGANISVAQLDTDKCFFSHCTHTVLSGESVLNFGRHSIASGPGATLVTSPNEAYQFHLQENCRRLLVMFEQHSIKRHLENLINTEVVEPLTFDVTMQRGPEADATWYRSLSYLCSQLTQSEQILRYDAFMQHSAEMLISLLLEMQPHNYSHLLNREADVSTPRSIRRAIDYIEEHISQPISLVELATAVGVSVRVLQKGFRRFKDCTPSEYIRAMRLSKIHAALLQADPNRTITEILYENGVTSAGHFGRFYKAKYGCSPGETLRSVDTGISTERF